MIFCSELMFYGKCVAAAFIFLFSYVMIVIFFFMHLDSLWNFLALICET